MSKIEWNEEKLKEAVKNSITIADVLRELQLKPLGSNYKTFKKYCKKWNIDTSHFLGNAYLTGKKRPPTKATKPLSFYLVENSELQTKHIKSRLISENLLPYRCVHCGLSDNWNGKSIVLQLDHINGINNDHRLENLQLLCPNCHSQTETYCGRNNKKPKQIKVRKPRPTKIVWLPLEELIEMVKQKGYSETGRILKVSGNAVKKHIKSKSVSVSSET